MKTDIHSHVTIEGLPPSVTDKLIKSATYPNPAWQAASEFSSWGRVSPKIPQFLAYAWLDEDGRFVTLRGFQPSPELRKLMRLTKVTDQRTRAPAPWPKPLLEPNDQQAYLLEKLDDTLYRKQRPFGGLLFLASTSLGKTILQLAVARRLGHRVLVLCPTEQILLAWYADAYNYLGLLSADIGIIKRDKFIIGQVITLASVATLAKRESRWPELNDCFGTVIVDEVQLSAAPSIQRFIRQSPAKWLVGATATETRADRPNHALRWMFGPPIASVACLDQETSTAMPLTGIRVVETAATYEYQAGNLRWDDLADNLALNEERNKLIVDNVRLDYERGRVCLLTTKSTAHVQILLDMLHEAGITEEVAKLTGDTNSDRIYSAGLIKLVNSRRVRIVVATAQAIKLGANIKALDSLHVTMPFATKDNFEQLIGRIRRKAEGKTGAQLVYYLDAQIPYMMRLYHNVSSPVFRKCKLPGFTNVTVKTHDGIPLIT